MLRINVVNMSCGGCAKGVSRAIRSVAPGAEVEVDLASRTVSVRGAPDATEVIGALARAGFEANRA